jgi:hypothetical protein
VETIGTMVGVSSVLGFGGDSGIGGIEGTSTFGGFTTLGSYGGVILEKALNNAYTLLQISPKKVASFGIWFPNYGGNAIHITL